MLKPLYDRIVVKKLEVEDRTPGGLIVPDTAKEKSQQGEVLAIGPGRLDESGNRQPINLKPGDKVLFARHSGIEVKLDGIEYLILTERDVLAIT